MKNNGIQNKKRFIEITINEDEAKKILIDIYNSSLPHLMCQDTNRLIEMLDKFEKEK